MQLTDMLANYHQVSQHQSNALTETTTPENSKNKQNQTPTENTASVVSISYEASQMREQATAIMQNYDLTNINQNQIEQLSEHLFNSKVINSQQYASLSFYSQAGFNIDDALDTEVNISPEQPQNVINKWQERLEHLREIHAKPIAQQQAVSMVNLLNNLQANKQ